MPRINAQPLIKFLNFYGGGGANSLGITVKKHKIFDTHSFFIKTLFIRITRRRFSK